MREALTIGLINLESPEPDAFSDEQVAFVIRLLDHASVAIANARLYAEVTAANIAKSDFVSVAASSNVKACRFRPSRFTRIVARSVSSEILSISA